MLTNDTRIKIAEDYMGVGQPLVAIQVLEDCGNTMNEQPYDYAATYVDALISAGRFEEADPINEGLLKAQPQDPAAMNRRGILLLRQNNPKMAIQRLREALGRHPSNLVLKGTLAAAHQLVGEYEQAIDLYGEILRQDPTMLTHRMYLGMAQMTLGDHQNGVPNYGARIAFANPCPLNGTSIWQGQDLTGKSIAVYAEQGVGDNIMMWRYLRDDLKEGVLSSVYGAEKVYYVCPPNLAEFFDTQRVFFNDEKLQILALGVDEVPKVDFQSPIMSFVAHAYLGNNESGRGFGRIGYIKAPKAPYQWPAVERSTRQKSGICLQGSKSHPNDQWRSIKPEQAKTYIEILRDLGDVFVISKEPMDPLLLSYGCKYLETPDLAAMAVAVSKMDKIITVDTAMLHMAGAIGKPTVGLLPVNPDWRWGTTGSETDWYSSVTLYRQETFGDWRSCFNQALTWAEFF